MATNYCRKHPGVSLNWLGACPRCKSEDDSKQNQVKLIAEQNTANQLMRQAMEENRASNEESRRLQSNLIEEQIATRVLLERQEAERKERREKESLQAGIIEFEDSFQKEWNTVAKTYNHLRLKKETIDKVITEKLEPEFTHAFDKENISNNIVTKIDSMISIDRYGSQLDSIHSDIAKHTTVKCENPGKNSNRLGNVIKEYINSKVYYITTGSDNRWWSDITMGIVSIVLGIYMPIWFILTLFTLAIVAVKYANTLTAKRHHDILDESFNSLAIILSSMFGQGEWNDTADAEHDQLPYAKLAELLRISFFSIKDRFRQEYFKEIVIPDSHSSGGAEAYSQLVEAGSYNNLDEFTNAVSEYEAKFAYMKNAIIEVGEEIHNGHRVPSRMEKKRIELIKCPSCGGPLAKDRSTACHYCGSQFARY